MKNRDHHRPMSRSSPSGSSTHRQRSSMAITPRVQSSARKPQSMCSMGVIQTMMAIFRPVRIGRGVSGSVNGLTLILTQVRIKCGGFSAELAVPILLRAPLVPLPFLHLPLHLSGFVTIRSLSYVSVRRNVYFFFIC